MESISAWLLVRVTVGQGNFSWLAPSNISLSELSQPLFPNVTSNKQVRLAHTHTKPPLRHTNWSSFEMKQKSGHSGQSLGLNWLLKIFSWGNLLQKNDSKYKLFFISFQFTSCKVDFYNVGSDFNRKSNIFQTFHVLNKGGVVLHNQ